MAKHSSESRLNFDCRSTDSDESCFSEGYGGSIQMHTAAAISHATKASIQKSGSRRISWGISRKTGINFSVEDLRHRSTKIVVLGKENVGKTGNYLKIYLLISEIGSSL